MRTILLAIVCAALPAFGASAEQPRLPKSDTTPSKQLPMKGAAAANACAQFGAGFVRVEGTQTCVKVGGAVSVGAGVSR
jgi:hypothetical protein